MNKKIIIISFLALFGACSAMAEGDELTAVNTIAAGEAKVFFTRYNKDLLVDLTNHSDRDISFNEARFYMVLVDGSRYRIFPRVDSLATVDEEGMHIHAVTLAPEATVHFVMELPFGQVEKTEDIKEFYIEWSTLMRDKRIHYVARNLAINYQGWLGHMRLNLPWLDRVFKHKVS